MIEGYVHPDFESVARAFRRQIPRRKPGGAALCVHHRGECVVDVWAGTRDAEGNAWREDTLALSYSTTLDYDEPVARYWPEFGQQGKAAITVRQLLCHEAGLYDIKCMLDHARRMLDWDYMVGVLERSRPVHPPGTSHGYHGLTFGWLVGELIQRVTGHSLRAVLAREIAEPLCLDGLFIGLEPHQMSRRARLVDARGPSAFAPGRTLRRGIECLGAGSADARLALDPGGLEAALLPTGMEEIDFDSEEVVAATIPAATGMFTARSLSRMYGALAQGGAIGGVRLLSQETLARATEVQSRRCGRVIPLAMDWRLGYHRVPMVRTLVSRGFGHCGFGGSGAWADPERELSLGLVLNSGVGSPFGDTRIIRVGAAAVMAADRR